MKNLNISLQLFMFAVVLLLAAINILCSAKSRSKGSAGCTSKSS